MKNKFLLIGLDGGASKVSGWIIHYSARKLSFKLSSKHQEIDYKDITGFNPRFNPVSLNQQLLENGTNTIRLTPEEIQQGNIYLEACFQVIKSLVDQSNTKKVLIGIGMPGLKTKDKKGIAAFANGPRMPFYLKELEKKIQAENIKLVQSTACLGSDADYCGIGEEYDENGSFKNINNGYYLGGGTGTADAIKLRGQVIPFDQIKSWLAKTWEMKNDSGISLEKYTSSAGLIKIYSAKSKITEEKLLVSQVFMPQIAQKALEGNHAAVETFQEAAEHLSLLLYERITTLYSGWQNLFRLNNPNRIPLAINHEYKNELLDTIVIGQRLADFLKSRTGNRVLMLPMINKLAKLIINSTCLDEEAKRHYLHTNTFRAERIILSPLRQAPALGAAIDAYLHWKTDKVIY
jgi:predicted NBD/HSP70 family sugar kinase